MDVHPLYPLGAIFRFSTAYYLTMDEQIQQPLSEEVKVETNNFHNAIEHFDNEGRLKDKDRTRFAIQCAICHTHDLALLNEDKDHRSRHHHETYAVLKCGHAFGYRCIHTWLLKHKTCPSCRENPLCRNEHFVMLDMFGYAGAHEQHKEINDIRRLLQRQPDCFTCRKNISQSSQGQEQSQEREQSRGRRRSQEIEQPQEREEVRRAEYLQDPITVVRPWRVFNGPFSVYMPSI